MVPRTTFWPLVAVVLALIASPVSAAVKTGEQVYREHCARCHGAKGEGVAKEYGKPLIGDKPLVELTKLIDETMPQDDPDLVSADEAKRVSAYVYDTFYSPVAQARNQPARIELSRLTVRQYRHAVADLLGSFRWNNTWGNERGLKGEYFKSREMRTNDRVISRLDPEVRFDFGTAAPQPEKFEAHRFSIRWEGAVLAPETGDYEFIVQTEHAARLWINDTSRPLIDAWVKSGDGTEHRESIRLLGGRVYPLRLEFSKATQGVNNAKNKDKPPPEVKASISLQWKLPDRVAEVIPSRNLTPNKFPVVCAVTTPFPPDDRSVGYERGTSVSQAWDAATTDAALEVAAYVSKNLAELSGVKSDAADRPKKLREFCTRFVERAFRRPLTDEQKQFFIERQFQETPDLDLAVKRVVLLALMSPRFLYHDADGGQADAYDVANRLSFGLWDSLPDQELLKAAAANQLSNRDQVRRHAERMIGDLRTRAKLHEFFLQWLQTDRFVDLAKDSKRFPEFDEEIVSDLRTALDLFLDEVVWSDASDFRQLLLADWLELNGRLGKFYDIELPADAPFQKVTAQKDQRAGVLTHPYLMAGFAYTSTSSPIHRGVFVSRSILGRALRPPPEAVAPLPPELHKDLTTRERVVLQTKGEACQACHRMINPLGFAFENFDAVGRYRKQEQGKPIDATGVYLSRTGSSVPFKDVRGLAKYLAESPETHAAFVEQLFHYVVKQPIRAHGPQTLVELRKSFTDSGCNIRKLVMEIVTASALHGR